MKFTPWRLATLPIFLIVFNLSSALPFEVERRSVGLRPLTECIQAGLRSSASDSDVPKTPRDQYIAENLGKAFTTVAQNKRYIKIAKDTKPGSNILFIHDENALMKELNDTLQDKNFVTSLNNRRTEILTKKLIAIETRNQGLEISVAEVNPYNDFKSSARAIRWQGKAPNDIQAQLNEAVLSATKEFTDELRERKIIRKGDLETVWFRTGMGDTADRASTAARLARELGTENRIVSYDEPGVQARLNQMLSETEDSRKALEELLSSRIPFQGRSGSRVPSEQIFDLIRKANGDPSVLLKSLQATFSRTKFSEQEAEQLLNYAKNVDRFSSSLRIAKREIVNLDNARFGGFTADFLGLGSANLTEIALALAKSKDPDQALQNTRKAEMNVTKLFKAKLKAFRTIVGDIVHCGGDDCVGVPTDHAFTESEKQDLVSRLAANPLTRRIRMAFIPEGVATASERTKIATQGEDIEKALRKNIAGQILAARLDQLTIAIDMQTQNILKGSADIIVGTEPGKTLFPYEMKRLRHALKEAVYEINRKISAGPSSSRYRSIRKLHE